MSSTPKKFVFLRIGLILIWICLALVSYTRGPVTSSNVLAKELPDVIAMTALRMHLFVESTTPIPAQEINLSFPINTKLFLKSIPRFVLGGPKVEERGEQYVLRDSNTKKRILCFVRIYGDGVIGVELSQDNADAPERLHAAFTQAFNL